MGVSLVQYRAQIGGFAGGRSCLAPFASFGSGDKVDKRWTSNITGWLKWNKTHFRLNEASSKGVLFDCRLLKLLLKSGLEMNPGPNNSKDTGRKSSHNIQPSLLPRIHSQPRANLPQVPSVPPQLAPHSQTPLLLRTPLSQSLLLPKPQTLP